MRPVLTFMEGRIPERTVQFIRYVRENAPARTVISVEVEKPGREGLLGMALLANFVFFSRSWALVSPFYQDYVISTMFKY
jgi:ketohexokinase